MSTEERIVAQSRVSYSRNPPQHSHASVFVASHYKIRDEDGLGAGAYNLSPDVISARVEETFQGQMSQLVILPRRPYHQWIYPGDWVSVYLSSGVDARSDFGVLGDTERRGENIRVFFGFVDSIKQNVSVGENGVTQVRYMIACSGIQKAFDRTMIYFNRSLSPKTYFGAMLPGLANLMYGVSLSGTPATIPRSLALAYMGFGGQFLMPDSYSTRTLSENERKKRLSRLFESNKAVEESVNLKINLGKTGKRQKPGLAARTVSRSKKHFLPNSIASIVDFFTYVRDLHVDGQVIETPLHESVGSLWQLMMENSNPIMNECFLTLKPDVSGVLGSGSKDEWGMSPRYVPALVIRERPFSWVDGRGYLATTSKNYWEVSVPGPRKNAGGRTFTFGDVFFSSINAPVSTPRLQQLAFKADVSRAADGTFTVRNSETGEVIKNQEVSGAIARSDKFWIDRVLIKNSDIVEESIGLSDNDHVNFFMITQSSIPIASNFQKFTLLKDGLVPIFIPESIRKYGLRVREMSTKFMYTGGGKIDSGDALRFLVRCLLAQDQWYQHNPFYRSGTIKTRLVPKARVGMALDVLSSDREESYYIEGVSHEWELGEDGKGRAFTSFTLTRGQPGLLTPSERFQYAPPDVATLKAGGKPVPRPKTAKQSQVERSPYPDEISRRDLLLKLLKQKKDDGLISQQSYDDIQARLAYETNGDRGKLTTEVIGSVVSKVGESDPSVSGIVDDLTDQFLSATRERLMNTLIETKEDRSNIGKSPWAEDNRDIWDAVRRPLGFRFPRELK